MRIEAVTKLTPAVHEALGRLLPQLNANLPMPDLDRLNRLLNDPDVVLLIARDGERIVGTTTVIVYTTPYWIKARLDGVVGAAGARGGPGFRSRSTIDASVAKAASTGSGDVMPPPAMRSPSSGYIDPALLRKARYDSTAFSSPAATRPTRWSAAAIPVAYWYT